MPTGIGVPPDANGDGVTPEDDQILIAADYYTDGIIDGCEITGTSTMEYQISPGAVIINTGDGMAVKVPVRGGRLPTATAPTSGSRTETLYVKQNFPQTDGDSLAHVGVVTGTVIPSNAIAIDRRVVPANITATTATTRNFNRKYALPIGGSLGRLHLAIDSNESPHAISENIVRGAGTIYVPTDRDVEFNMTSTASLATQAGLTPDSSGLASIMYKFYLDGNLIRSWERGINRFWESKQLNFIVALAAGEHQVRYEVKGRFWDPSFAVGTRYWAVRHGGTEQFSGDAFRIYDRGVIHW